MNATLCDNQTFDPVIKRLKETGIPPLQLLAGRRPIPTLKFDTNRVVGRQIKRLRVEANMSQQALAEQCRFFRTYISRIESGQANPTVNVLAQLARGLNAEIADFFME